MLGLQLGTLEWSGCCRVASYQRALLQQIFKGLEKHCFWWCCCNLMYLNWPWWIQFCLIRALANTHILLHSDGLTGRFWIRQQVFRCSTTARRALHDATMQSRTNCLRTEHHIALYCVIIDWLYADWSHGFQGFNNVLRVNVSADAVVSTLQYRLWAQRGQGRRTDSWVNDARQNWDVFVRFPFEIVSQTYGWTNDRNRGAPGSQQRSENFKFSDHPLHHPPIDWQNDG